MVFSARILEGSHMFRETILAFTVAAAACLTIPMIRSAWQLSSPPTWLITPTMSATTIMTMIITTTTDHDHDHDHDHHHDHDHDHDHHHHD